MQKHKQKGGWTCGKLTRRRREDREDSEKQRRDNRKKGFWTEKAES